MKRKLLGLPLLLAFALAGCGTNTPISSSGEPSDGRLVWPAMSSVTLDHHRGTYGDLHRIKMIRPGATRDQVTDLIGHPQFHEGFHTREWDYLFYFYRDGVEIACQYKVLFDKNYRVNNTYWKDQQCEGKAPEKQRITLSADALFRFDGGSLHDLLPGGQRELDKLANVVKGQDVSSVKVFGYTDRIGSDSYNMRLSRERTNTVRSYLIMRGIMPSVITAEGFGESNPVVQCRNQSRRALIQCLQPNRRVEVEIN